MKFDIRFADALGQGDLVVNKPGIPKMAWLSPRLKHRLVAAGAAALLAFAVGLLVAALGAWAADEPPRPRSAIERAGTDSVRVQPTAKQFAPPNQSDVSAVDARTVDELYRVLIGRPPATSSGSRSGTLPLGSAER